MSRISETSGSSRENRVNQSGSVALSAEGVRGPPQRKGLIIMALLTQGASYEPGGRGFKSCRARRIIKGLQRCGPFSFPTLRDFCVTFSRNRPQKCHRWRASGGIDPVHRLEKLGNFRGRVMRGYAPVVVSQ